VEVRHERVPLIDAADEPVHEHHRWRRRTRGTVDALERLAVGRAEPSRRAGGATGVAARVALGAGERVAGTGGSSPPPQAPRASPRPAAAVAARPLISRSYAGYGPACR
jgi:hypothetical protein